MIFLRVDFPRFLIRCMEYSLSLVSLSKILFSCLALSFMAALSQIARVGTSQGSVFVSASSWISVSNSEPASIRVADWPEIFEEITTYRYNQMHPIFITERPSSYASLFRIPPGPRRGTT